MSLNGKGSAEVKRAYGREASAQIQKLLLLRLEQRGVTAIAAPGLIRDLVNTLSAFPHLPLREINKRLRFLGWADLDLDEHTFQLAVANADWTR